MAILFSSHEQNLAINRVLNLFHWAVIIFGECLEAVHGVCHDNLTQKDPDRILKRPGKDAEVIPKHWDFQDTATEKLYL